MNGVPDTIVYSEKPRATAASRVRQNFQPINGREFSPSSQIHFSLACGRKGAFLDPRSVYLKFKLHNSGGTALQIDYSAHSVIRLLEVYYGSTQLEYINEYGSIVTALIDSQADITRESRSGTILEGVANASRAGATVAANSNSTFCLPLVSGIVGSMTQKLLPVGSMTRDNLRLSLTLADLHDIQYAAASLDWKVDSVELICEYVMISPEVARVIESMSPQGIRVPMTSFSLQANTVPANTTNPNLLLSGNFRSVKTLFTMFRLAENKGSAGASKRYIANRVNPIQNLGSWTYDIAGFKVPQTPVRGSVESYMELQKAFHHFSAIEGVGLHKLDTWTNETAGSFLIAVDLDHFGGKSAVSESGVDISTSSCYFQADFGTDYTGTAALRCDTWFHFDGVLYISPDGAAAQTMV